MNNQDAHLKAKVYNCENKVGFQLYNMSKHHFKCENCGYEGKLFNGTQIAHIIAGIFVIGLILFALEPNEAVAQANLAQYTIFKVVKLELYFYKSIFAVGTLVFFAVYILAYTKSYFYKCPQCEIKEFKNVFKKDTELFFRYINTDEV